MGISTANVQSLIVSGEMVRAIPLKSPKGGGDEQNLVGGPSEIKSVDGAVIFLME